MSINQQPGFKMYIKIQEPSNLNDDESWTSASKIQDLL